MTHVFASCIHGGEVNMIMQTRSGAVPPINLPAPLLGHMLRVFCLDIFAGVIV